MSEELRRFRGLIFGGHIINWAGRTGSVEARVRSKTVDHVTVRSVPGWAVRRLSAYV